LSQRSQAGVDLGRDLEQAPGPFRYHHAVAGQLGSTGTTLHQDHPGLGLQRPDPGRDRLLADADLSCCRIQTAGPRDGQQDLQRPQFGYMGTERHAHTVSGSYKAVL
jgi:hypothetical protein